jgi:transposase
MGTSGSQAAEPAGGTISCSICGTTVEQPPLTWMLETDPRRGAVWVCDRCARQHLRAIEGKLDQEWW